jgi:hypothetical protein
MPKISRSTPVLPGSAAGILQQHAQQQNAAMQCRPVSIVRQQTTSAGRSTGQRDCRHNLFATADSKCSSHHWSTPLLPGSAAGILQQRTQPCRTTSSVSTVQAVWRKQSRLRRNGGCSAWGCAHLSHAAPPHGADKTLPATAAVSCANMHMLYAHPAAAPVAFAVCCPSTQACISCSA